MENFYVHKVLLMPIKNHENYFFDVKYHLPNKIFGYVTNKYSVKVKFVLTHKLSFFLVSISFFCLCLSKRI